MVEREKEVVSYIYFPCRDIHGQCEAVGVLVVIVTVIVVHPYELQ